ncbi:MAG: putative transcriptional regulatory protein [Pedosphaera sp.]|nr:putative transcriptional regulatory protein [Pedosphaera sp.]
MGAQWKQAGRVANSTKRGAMIGKLVKEILVAAKLGDPHPENNARLWVAVEAAKKHSVPRDTIDRAIKKGAGLLDEKVTYELVTYEGFAPSKVPVIVECLTENRNRTAPEIRQLFKLGQFGAPGSVAFMFDRWGIVEANHADKTQDIEGAAIEAGAQEVQPMDGEDVPENHVGARFLCNPTDLDAVSKYLSKAKWVITTSEMSYLAKNYVELSEEQKKEVSDFLNALDEHDDVHRVYTALK